MSKFDTEEAVTGLVRVFANGSEDKVFENEFVPQIAFYTEDEPEAPRIIFFPEMTGEGARGPISWAIHVLASSIDNLAGIAFIHDGYKTSQMTKTDGTPWGPGEMQHAFLNKTEDAHLLTESLFYSVVSKDAVHMAGLEYERDENTVHFKWDDLSYACTQDENFQSAGFYPDLLRRAMDAPKIIEHMAEQFGLDGGDFGLDTETARIHALSICVKMVLIRTGMHCMIPCRSAEEQEVLQRSMKEGPFSEIIRSLDQDQLEEIVTLNEAFNAPAFGES